MTAETILFPPSEHAIDTDAEQPSESPEQIRQCFKRLGATHQTQCRQMWAKHEFHRTLWDDLAANGLLDLVQADDPGSTVVNFGAALEGLASGTGDPGFSIVPITHAALGMALVGEALAGAAREAWMTRLATGREILSFALTEEVGGTDALRPQVTLTRDGEDYLLDGVKWHITSAPIADLVMVFATDTERNEPVFALLETSSPGVSVTSLTPAGTHSAPVGRFAFDHVRVPRENVFGWGNGRKLLNSALHRERLMVGYVCSGAIERILRQATEFSVSREVAGTVIAQHQHIQRRLVDIRLRLSLLRPLTAAAAARVAAGERHAREASEVKLFAIRALMDSVVDAIQICGSYGVQEDFGLFQVWLDAICSSIAGGTEEAHRLVIMRELVLEYAEVGTAASA